MSIPAAWPQVLDFFGTPLVIEPSPGQLSSEALLTSSVDNTGRAWHLATGKQIGPAFRHENSVTAIVSSPDGRTLLTVSDDGTARLWALPAPVSDEPGRVARWVEALTGQGLDEQGAVRLLEAGAWAERRRAL